MALDNDQVEYTSFPASHQLSSGPLSPSEDGTFSILPRYLLQRVKNTFGAGDVKRDGDRPAASRQNSSSGSVHNSNSSSRSKAQVAKVEERTTISRRPPPSSSSAAASASRPHLNNRPTINAKQTRIASIRDEEGSTVSRRSHRLSNVGSSRRTLPPVLSRPHAEFTSQSPYLGAGSLSRSYSTALSTLPEGSGEHSPPPPPYSTSPGNPFNVIPGFPISRDVMDDAKSMSSVAATNTGVTQIFRRLRGEALSRDYWMADEAAVDCYDCNTAFTTWRRKHHCRVCGRIFCSRCASNIIPGARFGHEGLIRVCNICVAILSHRSKNGGHLNDSGGDRSGLPASSSVANLNISLPLQSSYRAGQSQYAGSTLFPRNDYSSYNLANAMSVDDFGTLQHRARRFSDVSLMRPATPDMMDDSVSPRPAIASLGSPLHFSPQKGVASGQASSDTSPLLPATTPAPFRKTTADEERTLPEQNLVKEDAEDGNRDGSDGQYHRVIHPENCLHLNGLGISDPATPLLPASPLQHFSAPGTNEGSRDGSGGGALGTSTGRPTTPSAVSFLAQPLGPSFVRSRLNSKAADQVFDLTDVDDNLLANPIYFDSLLRVHDQYSNFSTDINFHKIAIDHIRTLLRQCLQQASVPNSATWENVLLKLLIKVAKGPRPRVAEGDSMDVRRYVKIKRVPGGTPNDSEYISGTVFTKSILNKHLPRLLTNPRIMIFDYAFEFEQGETRMSRLDSLRDSERDSLRKLTNSVIDHRPHIVIVGKSVSGLALDYLHKAGIVVARNVKPAVLQAVARCTQAGIFDTYQFFPDNTRLGRCAVFRATTLVHKLIPGGRKTLLRFEGCNKELGATILLRGADIGTLSKIKRIMRFMTLAAYSVRLELQLLWDEQASLASDVDFGRIREFTEEDTQDVTSDEEGEEAAKHHMKQKETARIINRALAPYVTRILSTSPTVVFPAPHSLERLRQDNHTIRKLRSHHKEERTITAASAAYQDLAMESTTTSASKGGEPEGALGTSAALTRSLSDVSLLSVKPQTRTRALEISAHLAEESQIQEADIRRNDHLLLWESRLARQQDDLTAASHQHLAVLQTVICQTTTRMCDGPKLVQRHYYREGSDQTLRQFVESTIIAASHKCPAKGCERVMLSHYTTYAHGQKRIHVVVEPHLAPPGSEEDILVWSVCRGCELKTLPTTLSEEAANFSFGKYLELSFYSDYLASRALPCEHNLHSDHIRFLCWRNVALRVMVDSIDVSDIVVPPLRLRVDAWTQLRIKNEEYRAIQKSTAAYWNSVLARIHNFNHDVLPVDRLESGRQALAAFEERANTDQRYFESLLDKAYEEAPITQPSALNSVRVALQAKVVHWETEFINFEQTFIPSEGEKARRATSSHLRRLFSDPNSSVPASPDMRTTFSPLPSVPASPMLVATPPEYIATSSSTTPDAANASIMSLVGKAAPLSPTLSKEGLPILSDEGLPAADCSLPDIPTLRLTKDTVAALEAASQARGPETHSNLSHMTSVRSLTSNKPSADEDAQTDSDSTVCAEPPRTMTYLGLVDDDRSESEDAISQKPVRARRPRPVSSIANLVHRFEEGLAESNLASLPKPVQQQVGLATSTNSRTPFRPGIRRGKSDFSEVRAQRTRQASDERETVLSDGDLPQVSSPARLGSTLRSPNKQGRPKSPAHLKKRPSLNTTPSTSSSSRASSNLAVPGSRTLKGSLGAPLRVPDREQISKVASSESIHARHPVVRSAGPSNIPDSRQVGQRPAPLILPKSAKKVPSLGPTPAAGNRVSTMTKHFNYLSRQAERERQKQLVLSRQRRARPLAVPKASVNVFVSSKEALKEDSDDEGSSSGADDEMDGEDDEDKEKNDPNVDAKSANSRDQQGLDLRQVNQYLRNHQATLPISSIPHSIATQVSMSSSEGSAGTDPVPTGSESGPSVPPSPLIGAEPTSIPRYGHMSESEMSSSTGTERQMSLMKTISSLWNYRGAEFTPLELPQSKLEHFDAGSRIVVREDEPSSIIAHGLDSQLYKNLMKGSQNYAVASSSEVFMPESEMGHGGNRSSNWDVLDFQTDAGTDLEEAMKKPTDRHLRLAWDDATLRYTMRVFFADQFDALRKNSGCQELFIESLARCHKWDAQGGKSGSAFLKTKDDRFIIKEISPAEMTALLDFAPKYFQYLSRAYFDDLPTVLAKILGVFRISFKSQSSGRNKRMDVLVMENIYYNKTISDQFDLKGSLRNRMVEVSGAKGCVLLDENLIQISYDKPFYVREHTKKHLETALHNDSLFLANQKIMDYSLIVGVDKSSTELVVGIVDFLRPYTWDKRLETWVKETAYIGAGPREPTILNPRIYKNRFREAMSRYFLLVPDRWTSAEAIATGQPPPILNTTAPSAKAKTAQNASILDEQEQFIGGASRTHSPTTSKRFVPMAG